MNGFAITNPVDVAAGVDEDARLLAATTSRDAKAFAALMSRHYTVVYRVVWRMVNGHVDAEDITQEAFLRLWNNPGQLREAGALRGWLIRVASNLAKDRHRHQPVSAHVEMDEFADNRDSAVQNLEQQQVQSRIDQAIARLPDRQRLAITLTQLESMGQKAAAEIMEISVDALESLVARARRALKEDLARDWQELREGLGDR